MFTIKVKTIEGNLLKFRNVESYDFEGNLLVFTDRITGKTKRFSSNMCEVEEE